MQTCPNPRCRQSCDDALSVCPHCGYPLSGGAAAAVGTDAIMGESIASPETERRPKRLLMGYVWIWVPVLIFISIIYSCLPRR